MSPISIPFSAVHAYVVSTVEDYTSKVSASHARPIVIPTAEEAVEEPVQARLPTLREILGIDEGLSIREAFAAQA